MFIPFYKTQFPVTYTAFSSELFSKHTSFSTHKNYSFYSSESLLKFHHPPPPKEEHSSLKVFTERELITHNKICINAVVGKSQIAGARLPD
jgi:hypothetical protein